MLALGHVASQFWVVGAKKGEFFVAPVVDLEPLGEVQRTKAHGESPPAFVEGNVQNGHG